MLCLKIAGWVANSVDPDEMSHTAVSHLGLHFAQACLSKYIWYKVVVSLFCVTATVFQFQIFEEQIFTHFESYVYSWRALNENITVRNVC